MNSKNRVFNKINNNFKMINMLITKINKKIKMRELEIKTIKLMTSNLQMQILNNNFIMK